MKILFQAFFFSFVPVFAVAVLTFSMPFRFEIRIMFGTVLFNLLYFVGLYSCYKDDLDEYKSILDITFDGINVCSKPLGLIFAIFVFLISVTGLSLSGILSGDYSQLKFINFWIEYFDSIANSSSILVSFIVIVVFYSLYLYVMIGIARWFSLLSRYYIKRRIHKTMEH